MAMRDQTHDVVTDHLVFIVIDSIDTRHVQTNTGEDTLPASLTTRNGGVSNCLIKNFQK
jgi:hypothetical protein